MIVTPRSTRNASSRPSRSQARFAFIVLFAINVLNYADRYVLPAILPKAQQDLGLTTIEEGLLGSSFLLVYGLTTLPLGAWADRGVRKNIISLCVGVWSMATTLGGFSRNFWQLISARDRKSTRLNSSHGYISYAVFCLKKKRVTNACYHRSSRTERYVGT